jgi:hypothetical protein
MVTDQRNFQLFGEIWQFIIEQQLQCFAGSHALLAARRQITTHAAKYLCAFHDAKTPGYFLMDFRHAYISLTLIIRKGHDFIIHKSQYILLKFNKALEKITDLLRFNRPRLPFRSFSSGGGHSTSAAFSMARYSCQCFCESSLQSLPPAS